METFYNILISVYAVFIYMWINRMHRNKIRAMFAAGAPDVPEWFNVNIPEQPTPDVKLNLIQEFPEKDQEIIQNYYRLNCQFDLPSHLQWYSELKDKFQKEYAAWAKLKSEQSILQWRAYYANKMMEELYG